MSRPGPAPEARETFDAAWLRLREPADHRSRAAELVGPLRDAWRERGWSRVLDLGGGTGSNVRYLADRLPEPGSWIVLDHDPSLLRQVRAPEAGRVRRVAGDLRELAPALIRGADLVTASALLDLVSEAWLRRVVEACRSASAGALFALTYAGVFRWSDARGRDDRSLARTEAVVRRGVNRHQLRDKGLGPALGPAAAPVAEALLRAAGYATSLRSSPWRLGPGDAELARALLDGWEAAALEVLPDQERRIRGWARRRREATRGDFTLSVAHLDLLALPPGPGSPVS